MRSSKKLPHSLIRRLVQAALQEDLGKQGDVTSIAIIPSKSISIAKIVSQKDGILCGLQIAVETFRQLDPRAQFRLSCSDGDFIRKGRVTLEIHAKTRAILSAERVALNFIQHLSGIATLTHRYLKELKTRNSKSETQILDTRKTTPLLRPLEKYAVRCGGGTNHRLGLFDMVLIKDNHLAALAHQVKYPIQESVMRARKQWPKLKIEVECDTLDQVREAIQTKPDIILLDNMNLSQLRRAVKIIHGIAKTEASGGMTLKSVAAIARAGVDFISIGALTHSASSLDFSLKIVHTK